MQWNLWCGCRNICGSLIHLPLTSPSLGIGSRKFYNRPYSRFKTHIRDSAEMVLKTSNGLVHHHDVMKRLNTTISSMLQNVHHIRGSRQAVSKTSFGFSASALKCVEAWIPVILRLAITRSSLSPSKCLTCKSVSSPNAKTQDAQKGSVVLGVAVKMKQHKFCVMVSARLGLAGPCHPVLFSLTSHCV